MRVGIWVVPRSSLRRALLRPVGVPANLAPHLSASNSRARETASCMIMAANGATNAMMRRPMGFGPSPSSDLPMPPKIAAN